MSKQRAHRRAERAQSAAATATAHRLETEQQARRAVRRQRFTGWLPRPGSGSTGVLAARRRQQTGLVLVTVATTNTLTWLGTGTWAPRVLVLLLSVLLTPIALSILSRRRFL